MCHTTAPETGWIRRGATVLAEMISPQVLSALIGSIYDCALDPSYWEKTLANAKDALGFETAALHLDDLRYDRVLISRIVGMEPHWIEKLAEHIPEIHVRLRQDLASWPSFDVPHVISRHVPKDYLENAAYFQQCLHPQGLVDIMQYVLLYTPTRLAGLGMGRHKRHGPRDRARRPSVTARASSSDDQRLV